MSKLNAAILDFKKILLMKDKESKTFMEKVMQKLF